MTELSAWECRWGQVLAEGQVGAGRGSRSLISKLKVGCVLHDASYHVPLEVAAASRSHLANLLLATRWVFLATRILPECGLPFSCLSQSH